MNKGKLLAICLIWLVIVGSLAVAWRLWIVPSHEQAARTAEQEKRLRTSGQSPYKATIAIALDPFSGYAVLRSSDFDDRLRQLGLKLELVDDGADYARRLERLAAGEIPVAAFTIDALVKTSAKLGELPATIVAILDETRGADAMVAYRRRIPNVEALNDPRIRFVLTPDSPSETLARVVMTHFQLERLPRDPFVPTSGPDETMAKYREARPEADEVFVTWEPYVSQMLENPNMHVVVDSSRFRGYIVDVLVVNRDYLLKNADLVRDLLAAYFAARNHYQGTMVALIRNDARANNMELTEAQARKLVAGIRWKNLAENFAHFGLTREAHLQHIEDMITNITHVLMRSGAVTRDPTGGAANQLYYERVLANLQSNPPYPELASEQVEEQAEPLSALTASEWSQLRPVGELRVPPLEFGRGSARLTGASQAALDDLVNTLQLWPQYYVLVRGNASQRGDPDANRQLAQRRAEAAAKYLIDHGIHANRVHAVGADPQGETTVSFVVGEPAR